jgi:hypothetical protein
MSDKVQIDQVKPLATDPADPPLALILVELQRIRRLLEIIADESVEVEDVIVDVDS